MREEKSGSVELFVVSVLVVHMCKVFISRLDADLQALSLFGHLDSPSV